MKITRLQANETDGVRVGTFLLETFAKEHRFGTVTGGEVNVGRAWEHVWDVLENGAAWVVENDAGDVLGSVSVVPTQLWWTDRQYLRDGWLYVEPSSRGTPAFIMLMETVEAYARADNRPLVVQVFNSGTAELAGKLLGRRGYAALGGTYIKEI